MCVFGYVFVQASVRDNILMCACVRGDVCVFIFIVNYLYIRYIKEETLVPVYRCVLYMKIVYTLHTNKDTSMLQTKQKYAGYTQKNTVYWRRNSGTRIFEGFSLNSWKNTQYILFKHYYEIPGFKIVLNAQFILFHALIAF